MFYRCDGTNHKSQQMKMHCVYCGDSIPVSTVLYASAPLDEKERRWAFELIHDARCGKKSVGIIESDEA